MHYNGTTTYAGEEAGRCVDSSVLVRAPQCPQEVSGVAELVSPDLAGFTFAEVFGDVVGKVNDFQCRQTCIGRTEDTTYCTGPHACNRPACTMVRTEDGAPDYLVARGCPVLLPDLNLTGRAINSLTREEQSLLSEARAAQCQTCAECGSDPPIGAVDWGLGCAAECSQLTCETGEVFDFTARADGKCRQCADLTDFRLCSSEDQALLEVNVDGASGLGRLLSFSSCRGKPGVGGAPAAYGRCESCVPPECAEGQFPRTCAPDSCSVCRLRNNEEMKSGAFLNTTFGREVLFCQLPQCEGARTGLTDSGDVCVRQCATTGRCGDGQHELACLLPHDTRCLDVEPARPAAAERRRVLPAHVNALEHATDATPALAASFENVLLNTAGLPTDQHVCVWDALGIVDNNVLPGGLSATSLPSADDVSDALGAVGTKHCRPIGHNSRLQDQVALWWDRDPARPVRLVPLQNTVLDAAGDGSDTPRRVLLNSSASVVAYGSEFMLPVTSSKSGTLYRPAGVLAGDFYLLANLQQAASASVLAPVPAVLAVAPAWVRAWELGGVLRESTPNADTLHPLTFEFGLATDGVMDHGNALPALDSLALTLGLMDGATNYTVRAAEDNKIETIVGPGMLRVYGSAIGVMPEREGCYGVNLSALGLTLADEDKMTNNSALAHIGLRSTGALSAGDILTRAPLQHLGVSDYGVPVIALRVAPECGAWAFATPMTVQVRGTQTSDEWNVRELPRNLPYLVLDVAVAQMQGDGQFYLFALLQQAVEESSNAVLTYATCDTASRECSEWEKFMENLDSAVALDAVLAGAADSTEVVVHALARAPESDDTTQASFTLRRWTLKGSIPVLTENTESTIALQSEASPDSVAIFTYALAVAPEGADVRTVAAIPVTLTDAGGTKSFDVALYVHVPGSIGHTVMLKSKIDGASQDSVSALFDNSARDEGGRASVQCRASLGWLTPRAFVAAWHCTGLLFRCHYHDADESADVSASADVPTSADITCTPLHRISAFAGSAFAHTPLSVSGPPNNMALELPPRVLSGENTVSTAAGCAPGFARAPDALGDMVAPSPRVHLSACALWCASSSTCQAYGTKDNECVVRAGDKIAPDDPVPRACARLSTVRAGLLPAALLQEVGLSTTVPAGIVLMQRVNRAVHVRGAVPLAAGENALVDGVVCAPADGGEVNLLEGRVDALPPFAAWLAAGKAAGALEVPREGVRANGDPMYMTVTLEFKKAEVALVVHLLESNVIVAVQLPSLTTQKHYLSCHESNFPCDIVFYVDSNYELFVHNTENQLLNTGGTVYTGVKITLPPGARLVRAHLDEVPVQSLEALLALVNARPATLAGNVSSSAWTRLALALPALPARSFVALTVRRKADVERDAKDAGTLDKGEWPTRESTLLARFVAVDALTLLPLLSRGQGAVVDDAWRVRVYVPTFAELETLAEGDGLDLTAAYSTGASTMSWPRVHVRIALRVPDAETERTWAARLRHMTADGRDAADQGALALLGCTFPAARLGVRECYVQLPVAIINDGERREEGQELALDVTCVDDTGAECDYASIMAPDALAVTIPPFMAINECAADGELLSRDDECVPCGEDDGADVDCPVGERRAVCVELRHPDHRHDDDCEACPQFPDWGEWTPPSAEFVVDYFVLFVDADGVPVQGLVESVLQVEDKIHTSEDTLVVECEQLCQRRNGCTWFTTLLGTTFSQCRFATGAALGLSLPTISVLTRGTSQETSVDVGGSTIKWVIENRGEYRLYKMTPPPPCTWQCQSDYYRDGDECRECAAEPQECEPGFRTRPCGGDHNHGCIECERPAGAELYENGTLYNIQWTAGECTWECKDDFYKESEVCQPCTDLATLRALAELQPAPRSFYRFDSCTAIADARSRACRDTGELRYTADAEAFDEDCPAYCEKNDLLDQFQEAVLVDSTYTCQACLEFQSNDEAFRREKTGCEPHCPDGYGLWNKTGLTQEDITDHPVACRRTDEGGCTSTQFLNIASCLNSETIYQGNEVFDCAPFFCEPCPAALLKPNQHYERYANGTSCATVCNDEYFFHVGADACLAHAVHAANCVPNKGFYWQAGSADFDAVCLSCTSCEGMEEEQACLEYSDAVCAECSGPLAPNAHWTGINCNTSACDAGFVRDLRGPLPSGQTEHQRPCDPCPASPCGRGERIATPRTHCRDCAPCPAKPANAEWTGPDGSCSWSCLGDTVVFVSAANETLCRQSRAASVYNDSLAASAPLATRLLCGAREYLDARYQCQSCVGRVPTPPAAEENHTWFWAANATACQWECLRGYVLFVDRVGARHCLTWEQYHSTALVGLTTARVDRQFAKRFARIETRQERLAALDLVQLAAVLVTCAVLIARGGARAEAEEGAGKV